MPNCSNATPAEHAWVLVRLVFHEGRLGGEWVKRQENTGWRDSYVVTPAPRAA